jgi:hypothetical protein
LKADEVAGSMCPSFAYSETGLLISVTGAMPFNLVTVV